MNKSGSPVGLGLVIVGAIAMAVAAFLPLSEPTGPLSRVRNNTLIQQGGGLLLIVLAIAIATTGYAVSQRNGKGWLAPTILCVLGTAWMIVVANDEDLRTLYPVGPDGTADTSKAGTVASLGIAIYVANAGILAALIGSLMLRKSGRQDPIPVASGAPGVAGAATRKCARLRGDRAGRRQGVQALWVPFCPSNGGDSGGEAAYDTDSKTASEAAHDDDRTTSRR